MKYLEAIVYNKQLCCISILRQTYFPSHPPVVIILAPKDSLCCTILFFPITCVPSPLALCHSPPRLIGCPRQCPLHCPRRCALHCPRQYRRSADVDGAGRPWSCSRPPTRNSSAPKILTLCWPQNRPCTCPTWGSSRSMRSSSHKRGGRGDLVSVL